MSLDANKDPLGLLNAFHALREKVPGARLTLVGVGPLQSAVRKFVRDNGLSDVVTLHDPCSRDEIARLMRDACDLLVLSSRSETFGVVLIEAMASGKPVVATRCGGPDNIITHPWLGRVCPPGDPAALCAALADTIADLPTFDAARIRARAAEMYDYSVLARRLRDAYEEVLDPESTTQPDVVDGLNRTPLVTIVTPAYNRARELAETIESVLAQTYPNIEYIVLDDGSTDETPEVLRRYASRVRCARHANMGEARTVNRGWAMAAGDFIATVNSDDPVFPDFVARAVAFMQAHPDVLVGYPDWVMIDEHGHELKHVQSPEYDQANMVLWSCCMPGPGAVMRRQALQAAGYRNPEFLYMGDYEFWLRVSRHGRFARIPHTLARWRNHRGATTNTASGPKMAAELVRIVHAFFESADLGPHMRAIQSEALAVAYYLAGTQCLEGGAIALARRYFLRSIYHHPFSTSYPTGLQRSIGAMLSHMVLPVPVRRLLKATLPRREVVA